MSCNITSVVLGRQFSNPSQPPLERAIRAYRGLGHLDGYQAHFTKKQHLRTVRWLRPDEIDRLVEGYRAGATVCQLAREFEISRKTVSHHLHDRGVRFRLARMTDEEARAAIAFYRQGLSMEQVAERLGRSTSLICLTLKRAGIQARDTHGRVRL